MRGPFSIPTTRRQHGVSSWIYTLAVLGILGVFLAAPARGAINVTPTTDGVALKNALNASGLTITSVTYLNGAAEQVGTYTGFSTPPITIPDGVVLSSGDVSYMQPPADPDLMFPEPNWSFFIYGTPEFDAYGLLHIDNFDQSYDVAVLRVDFHLATPSQIRFDFIFGSVEYPHWTGQYTDALLVFLDGTDPTNQITFDKSLKPIQVGNAFAGVVEKGDQNTAFADPHGMTEELTTTSPLLSAGDHTLLFEVGDVKDDALDSAAFIANLRAEAGDDGTDPSLRPPRLLVGGIQKLGVSNLTTLVWTNNGVPVALEQSAKLTSDWTEVTNSRATNSGMISTVVTNSATSQFFRLRKKLP